jgi:hypothetical protein
MAHFAARAGKCVEHVSQDRRYVTVNDLRISFLADSAPTYIYCDFGDGWRAVFSGSLNARNEFYAFLEAAQEVKQ